MFSIDEKVKFKGGLFNKVLGDVTFTVTGIYNKGDILPNGEVYNGPDELYQITTENPAVPKELRVTYQKEYCIRSLNETVPS